MRSTNYEADGERLLRARDAAVRLGVKLDTLYAYVSRGLLRSVAVPGSRERHYRADDVERFRISRGVERGRDTLIPVINSAICLIEGGRFFYRGHDALRLADTASLEEVADLLWWLVTKPVMTPTPSPSPGSRGRRSGGVRRRSVSEGQKPRGGVEFGLQGLIGRVQVRLATLAAEDFAAFDLRATGIIRTGRTILAELVAAMPGNSGEAMPNPRRSGPVHRRLAGSWGLDEAGRRSDPPRSGAAGRSRAERVGLCRPVRRLDRRDAVCGRLGGARRVIGTAARRPVGARRGVVRRDRRQRRPDAGHGGAAGARRRSAGARPSALSRTAIRAPAPSSRRSPGRGPPPAPASPPPRAPRSS